MKKVSADAYLTLINDNIPFVEYIDKTKTYIAENRRDLTTDSTLKERILAANAPYEIMPQDTPKTGALLIHGLLDSPFSLRDIALRLKTEGILLRSVLLPGHGTRPDALLNVHYEDWLKAVRYGIQSFAGKVDKLYLIGYSTGAALSIYHLLQNEFAIAGVVMLSPAIKIKADIRSLTKWRKFTRILGFKSGYWLIRDKETDYAKYRSIAINAVTQVEQLTKLIKALSEQKQHDVPLLMVLSQEDDTVSSIEAIDYFKSLRNPKSELLLYAKEERDYNDSRILRRPTAYPELNVFQFSHVSIPFVKTNEHYGQHGDFIYASHLNNNIYGPYNPLQAKASDFLVKVGLLRRKRHELTYNPDFEFMMQKITDFIQ